jgi:uncharacterized SAM-binding protein YcdF (DUF218 family)
MFFVVSKLLAFFEEPSNVVILAGIVGLILTRTRYARWGWRLAVATLVLIALIGFLPIGKALTIALENRFPRWEEAGPPPAGIIVLGGAVSAYRLATRGEIGLTDAAERILVVPELAKRFPNAKIIYSGGDPGLFTRRGSEADVIPALFESLGVPPGRIMLESRSRNTAENAVYSKALAAPKPGERWLLVTSAMHMPRAIGAFREAGFPVEAYPVDYKTNGWQDLGSVLGSLSAGLRQTDTALHEWIGLLAYRLTGKSSALLPGPLAGSFSGTSAVSARRAPDANWRRHSTMTMAVVEMKSGHGPANQPR